MAEILRSILKWHTATPLTAYNSYEAWGTTVFCFVLWGGKWGDDTITDDKYCVTLKPLYTKLYT